MSSEGENEVYVPHAIHTWLGLLKSRDLVITKEEGARFGPFAKDTERRLREALSSFGWVYCVDCKQPLFTLEDAMEHARRGHLLTNEFMRDDVAAEEAPTVS